MSFFSTLGRIGIDLAAGTAGFLAGGPIGALAAVSATESTQSSIRGTIQQKKALKLQRRLNDVQNQRNIQQFVRKSRIAQGRIANAAANTGALQSSSAVGGISSASSQLFGGVSFLQQSNALTNQALRLQSSALTNQAIGSVAGTIFQATGGFKTLFGSASTTIKGTGGASDNFR